MKKSASTEFMWQLAAQEAIAGHFQNIEPEHFCMALLKLSELPMEEVNKIVANSAVVRELAADVNTIRDELVARSINTTRTRRRLRKQMGKGNSTNDKGQIHRSKASRELMDVAAALAVEVGTKTLTPCHMLAAILSSPSEVLQVVLDCKDKAGTSVITKLPHLAKHGVDLVQLAGEGRLLSGEGRKVEGKVIVRALADFGERCILIVTNDGDAAMQAVREAAVTIQSKQCPPALKQCRIVDVTSIESLQKKYASKPIDEFEGIVEKFVAETSSVDRFVLVWPAIQLDRGTGNINRWAELLMKALASSSIRCICRITPRAYHKLVNKDSTWQLKAHVMWIRNESDREIPDEF
ncbi:hypothetical protein ACFL5F_01420 [Planctomycetota bacterium]